MKCSVVTVPHIVDFSVLANARRSSAHRNYDSGLFTSRWSHRCHRATTTGNPSPGRPTSSTIDWTIDTSHEACCFLSMVAITTRKFSLTSEANKNFQFPINREAISSRLILIFDFRFISSSRSRSRGWFIVGFLARALNTCPRPKWINFRVEEALFSDCPIEREINTDRKVESMVCGWNTHKNL